MPDPRIHCEHCGADLGEAVLVVGGDGRPALWVWSADHVQHHCPARPDQEDRCVD